jgi:hypothetical protein
MMVIICERATYQGFKDLLGRRRSDEPPARSCGRIESRRL